ncbi:hypothetical protein K378_04063 [Streptomyces sp. Amel2xB2]|nr:hypothetical protein K378_04063 [Streptomyces sp. Amel2xB2]
MAGADSITHWAANQRSRTTSRYRDWRHRVHNPGDCPVSKQLDSDLERLRLPHTSAEKTKFRLNTPDVTLETFPFAPFLLRVIGLSLVIYVLDRAAPFIFVIGAMLLAFRWLFIYGLPSALAYSVLYRCTHTVGLCADVYEESVPYLRRMKLRKLDRACGSLERQLLAINRSARTMSSRSPRRQHVRQHAAKVANVLRSHLYRIDTDGENAVRDLAVLLVEISESCAVGRIGALLSESYQLENVTPVSTSRTTILESLHVVATFACAIAAAIGVAKVMPSLPVPGDLQPWVLLVSALSAGILVAGWRRVERIIESFPGK